MLRAKLATSEHEHVHPTDDDVRTHLQRVLASADFNASHRNRRFLSYVIEETLAGRADRIKAYSIALAAFDRTEDFDPLTDPIVRIEASRLRRSLEHYYLTAGKSDRVRIEIPKGSYAAAFSYAGDEPPPEVHAAASEPAAPEIPQPVPMPAPVLPPVAMRRRNWAIPAAGLVVLILFALALTATTLWNRSSDDRAAVAGSRGPSIIVLPFEDNSGDPGKAFVARGLTYEIIANLTQFDDLFVFGAETSFSIGKPDGAQRSPLELKADYVLSGSVHTTGDRLRVSVMLADLRTGQYLWSWNTERDLATSSLLAIETDIAGHVANTIAQPYGIVFERSADEIAAKPAASLLSYECVVRFRQYWRSYAVKDFDSVRDCLENTVADDPEYARGYASLALLYIDAHRFGFGRDRISFDPLLRADELAQKAIALDPQASEGYLALSMANWFEHKVDAGLQAAERGLSLNPHDPDLLAELGFRYSQLAKWDLAIPLISEAYERNPAAPTGYHIATFLYAYMRGDYPAAMAAAEKAEAPNVLYGHIARAMVYAQLGYTQKASTEVAEILAIDPKYGDHIELDLAKRNLDPTIVRAVVDGLAKAGLGPSTTN